MTNAIYQPVFLKAHIAFTVDKHMLNFTEKSITPFGTHSLPWNPLSPKKHFGRKTIVNLRVLVSEPVNIQTPARITREHSFYGEQMGLRFEMDPEQRKILDGFVKHEGHHPGDYSRKYPRIPTTPDVPSFPMRVLGVLQERQENMIPLIFDVGNISIGGILLKTENPYSLSIQLGHQLDLYLEPRGDLPLQISMQGQVCRIMEDLSTETGNLVRYFGVKFTRISEENRAAYLELLKDVLERLKMKF